MENLPGCRQPDSWLTPRFDLLLLAFGVEEGEPRNVGGLQEW